MVAQKGKEFLMLLGDAATPEVFTKIGGQRSTDLKINNEFIDTTNKDSDQWRQLIEGGIRSFSSSGNGVFVADTPGKNAIDAALNGHIKNYQIFVPGLGTFEGPFGISEFSITGENNGAVSWAGNVESAGEITFTAV